MRPDCCTMARSRSIVEESNIRVRVQDKLDALNEQLDKATTKAKTIWAELQAMCEKRSELEMAVFSGGGTLATRDELRELNERIFQTGALHGGASAEVIRLSKVHVGLEDLLDHK